MSFPRVLFVSPSLFQFVHIAQIVSSGWPNLVIVHNKCIFKITGGRSVVCQRLKKKKKIWCVHVTLFLHSAPKIMVGFFFFNFTEIFSFTINDGNIVVTSKSTCFQDVPSTFALNTVQNRKCKCCNHLNPSKSCGKSMNCTLIWNFAAQSGFVSSPRKSNRPS